MPDREIGFRDRLQGDIRAWLPKDCGDFILKRADALAGDAKREVVALTAEAADRAERDVA